MQTLTTPATNMVLVVNRAGETIHVGNGRMLVASKSQPGRYYDVTDGTCQCPAWTFRGRCRHIAANANRPEPTAPANCPRCQRPTTARDASPIAKLGQCARCTNELLYGPEEVA